MKKDYSMFRFYKGEQENPFDQVKENAAHMFWFYESIFNSDFLKNESSDWYSFFSMHDTGDKFMAQLEDEDYIRPSENKKKQIFELWLEYLFTFKLYPEYGGENTYKAKYFSTTVR
jgi:hypothetical protein